MEMDANTLTTNDLKVRFWFLTIDNDVPKSSCTKYPYVANLITKTLSDTRGWKKHGYIFHQLMPSVGGMYRKDLAKKQRTFHIRLSTNETIHKVCGFKDLSCASMQNDKNMYMNAKLWIENSENARMHILDYRRYVINHEIGHLLGFYHDTCSKNKDEECSIMYQQTISKGCCKPNPWVGKVGQTL